MSVGGYPDGGLLRDGDSKLLGQTGIAILLRDDAEFDVRWEALRDEDGKHPFRFLPRAIE